MHTEAALHDALKYHIDVADTGTRRYFNAAGQLHRDEGPAIIWDDGDLEWWQNGQWHREDGPAVEWHDSTEIWFQNGSCHRVNGPAVVWANGHVEWHLYGQEYTEQGYHETLAELGIAK